MKAAREIPAGVRTIFQPYLSILEHTYTSSTHLALSWTLLPPVSPRSDRTRETPEKVSLPFGRIPLPGRGVGRQGNPEHHPPLRIPQDPSSPAKGRYWGQKYSGQYRTESSIVDSTV